jgi:predicted ATPase
LIGANGNTGNVGFDQLSAGTRRIVRILVSALFDNSSVMLIEQPEDGLHQGLATKLIGLLRQNALPAQLILSSHSSAVLNSMEPEEVRLVSLNHGATIAKALTTDELRVAEKFMNDDGPLYDFLETVQED